MVATHIWAGYFNIFFWGKTVLWWTKKYCAWFVQCILSSLKYKSEDYIPFQTEIFVVNFTNSNIRTTCLLLQEKCVRHAERCVRQARLIALQCQLLTQGSKTTVINLHKAEAIQFIQTHSHFYQVRGQGHGCVTIFVELLQWFLMLFVVETFLILLYSYTPAQRSWRGVYWFHLVHLPVCSSVDSIVSVLYLPQYLLDPFHIYTSYQATSEGVSPCKDFFKIEKFEVLANSLNL